MAHDRKEDVLDMLRELAELTMLDEADPMSFRVRAYERAARAILIEATDLGRLTETELLAIDGVGKSTADKVRQLVQTGKVDRLEALRSKYPARLVALLRVPGLGPKAVRRLRDALGVGSIEDLRAALDAHRVRDLAGFGEKSEQKLARALARMSEGGPARTPISVALPLARRVVAALAEAPGVVRAEIGGAVRRFAELVLDVDLVVAAERAGPVLDAAAALPAADDVTRRADASLTFTTRRGTVVHVRVVPPGRFGAALFASTGSDAHVEKVRARCAGDALAAADSEEAIYATAGLPWIRPELREDGSEIDAADRGALPAPIGPLLGDFHIHTTTSRDGLSSLDDVVTRAKERGLRVLAITDHAEGTLSGATRDAFLAQREKIRALNASLGDALLVLHGAELNIGPEGELDWDPAFRATFDFCVASVHGRFDLDRAAQTRRITTAMRDPSVRVIGHLTARMIGGRPPIDLDLGAVFAAAEETGTALEVNGSLPRLDLSVDTLRDARDRDVRFVLTSDAHRVDELALTDHARRNAERAWIDPSRVVNAGDEAALRAWAVRRPGPAG